MTVQGERLEAQGFDKSTPTDSGYHVSCSQCEALVINGVACHEIGCPNAPRTRRRPFEEEDE